MDGSAEDLNCFFEPSKAYKHPAKILMPLYHLRINADDFSKFSQCISVLPLLLVQTT